MNPYMMMKLKNALITKEDIEYFHEKLSEFFWYRELIPDRKMILLNMCFVGLKKLLNFNKMIEALLKYDFEKAAIEILKKEKTWAHKGKERALSLAKSMVTGIYMPE